MSLVPKNRLLFAVGISFLPLSILVAFEPSRTMMAFMMMAGLIVIVLYDAIKALGQLAGIRVTLPEVVRLSKFREGDIELHIENDGTQMRRIRLGLAFPMEIHTQSRDLCAVLPADTFLSTLRWPCKGLKQGRYILNKCYLEATSPIGFWALRTSRPAQTEVRVYPNLLVERKNLTSLFLNRGLGIHAQRQVGKGREFEQLREYLPGDCFEDIHWKATARRGQPITKVFQIERTQQIYVIIDSSRLSARDLNMHPNEYPSETAEEMVLVSTILERFITAALVICLAAERQGDLFGLITFDNRVQNYLGAKSGKAHFNACRDAIYTLQPRGVTPDFSELFTFIGTRIRRRALLVFLTHLDDPILTESFTDNIDIISRKHLVLVNMLRPAEAQPIFSSASISSVDEIYRCLGGHVLWKGLRETEKVLKRRGVGFTALENETMCTDLISQYLTLKRRQVL
jgi:uncharacterized protein (DUF58 family)